MLGAMVTFTFRFEAHHFGIHHYLMSHITKIDPSKLDPSYDPGQFEQFIHKLPHQFAGIGYFL